MRLTLPPPPTLAGLRALLPPADATLAVSAALVFGAGALLPSYKDSYDTWYATLRKPSWNPPR